MHASLLITAADSSGWIGTGWFVGPHTLITAGHGVYTDSDLLATTANLSGYPGDKPTGTEWYGSRRIASVTPRKVHCAVDTFGGQSGSAVHRIKDGARYAVAIHAYGGSTTNSGTRISTDVFNNIKTWKS